MLPNSISSALPLNLLSNLEAEFYCPYVLTSNYRVFLYPTIVEIKAIAEKQPKTFITDGAPNFQEAYTKEFYTRRKGTEHIREIRMASKVHNNKMERMNCEIRDRERCMRTLEKSDTPIPRGMQIYHNYVRPHMALKGKTPSEAAGIKVEGENKWLTLIENAARKR